MIYTSAQRYLTPKWQARVTPGGNPFKFSNGVTVSSLWELKQALRIIREDVINEHILGKKNEIIEWIRKEVQDPELVEALGKPDSRWAMIVALERQMMRTINLPHNVAERWLGKMKWPFNFVDGTEIESLSELASALDKINEETFNFHLERDPNDIAKWVNDIVGDYVLSEIVAEATNKKQMFVYVADHVVMLEHALSCK